MHIFFFTVGPRQGFGSLGLNILHKGKPWSKQQQFLFILPMKLDERFYYSRGVEKANFRVDTCPGTSKLP